MQNRLVLLMAQRKNPFQYEPRAPNSLIREALSFVCTPHVQHSPKLLVWFSFI